MYSTMLMHSVSFHSGITSVLTLTQLEYESSIVTVKQPLAYSKGGTGDRRGDGRKRVEPHR